MNPLASAIVETWPYVLAFVIGAAVPVRQSRVERFAIGLVALLGVAFVRFWIEPKLTYNASGLDNVESKISQKLMPSTAT